MTEQDLLFSIVVLASITTAVYLLSVILYAPPPRDYRGDKHW